jgi:acetylornithine deacetylase/succinyl-diaminopimelate desuccinylase-like protein
MSRLRIAALLLASTAFLAPGSRTAQADSHDSDVAPLDEVARWLQSYVQIDTTNPPGHEERAASLLSDILHREGIATSLYVSPSGRVNLYAKLDSGHPERGAIVLLHHMDVVPPGSDWQLDPFGGVIHDGELWGRGAIDDKSLGIAHLAAFLALHRSHATLTRDVVFLSTSDEESGGGNGTGWLFEAHPELFDKVAGVLTEGGSNRSVGDRVLWWGVEVTQKRPLWLRVSARGEGGHASRLDRNTATDRLVEGLARVVRRPPQWHLSPDAENYFEDIARFQSARYRDAYMHLDEIAADGRLTDYLLPGQPTYFLDTVQVTQLHAGDRVNVIPTKATATLDARLLPDTDSQGFLDSIKTLLGPGFHVEVLLESPPAAASPSSGPIWDCVADVLGESAPVVPSFIAGVTDARYFRQHGVPAYGVSPFLLDGVEMRGVHGVDEAIPLDAFERGVETMTRILRRCATE